MSNYLAFDLGTKTGVAFYRYSEIVVEHWNLTPPRGESSNYGVRFIRFRQILEVHYARHAPQQVFFEEVHAHKGCRAAHIYGGFLAVLAMWAEKHSLPLTGVGVGTIKRRITGKGNASKQAVMNACRARGYDPKTFDEADALALLLGVLDNESNTSNMRN